MSDLAAWLLERIAEDEAVARRNRGAGLDDGAGYPDYQSYIDDDTRAADEFIRHFTATRVLAECDAKRRIVALHEPNDDTCSVCALQDGSKYGDGWGAESWPCDTLRALASVYADHESFREEWR